MATLAQCWRQAGNYTEAERCEAFARLAETARNIASADREKRMEPIRAKHAIRRERIAAIRSARKEEADRRWQVWAAWYHTFDCPECGHRSRYDATPCTNPACKYGRVTPEPVR